MSKSPWTCGLIERALTWHPLSINSIFSIPISIAISRAVMHQLTTKPSYQAFLVSSRVMAQYGGEQYGQKQTDEYGNPIRRSDEYGTTGAYKTDQYGATGGTVGGYGNIGQYGTTGGTTGEYGANPGKVDSGVAGNEEGGRHRRSGSNTSSSSEEEEDGQGGRRKKKGIVGKIKDVLPGGGHKVGEGQEQREKI